MHSQAVGQFSHPVAAGEERVVSVEITGTMTWDEVCSLILHTTNTLY